MVKSNNILNIWTLGIILVVYVIVDIIQYFGGPSIVIGLFCLQILVAIVLPKQGTFLLILGFFMFDDLAYLPELEPGFYSYYTCVVGGQTLSTLMIFFLISMIIAQSIYQRKIPIGNWFFRLFVFLFLFSTVTGIVRGNLAYLSDFIGDFRFFLNFIVGFLITYLLFKESDYKYKIIPYLGVIFICKGFILLYKSVLLASSGTIYTIVADTGSYLSVFFMTYFIYLLTKKQQNFLIPLIGVLSLLLILGVSASRGRFLIVTLSIMLFLWATKRLQFLPIIVAGGVALVLLIPLISPEMGDYVLWKLTSFNPSEGRGESSLVRFVEYVNIIHQNLEDFDSFVFGEGLAGSWNSDYFFYPFNLIGSDSYPDRWIRQDKFFKPHGIIQFMLLKIGMLGTIVFYISIFILFIKRKALYIIEKVKSPEAINMTLVLTSGFITFFLVAYSAKLQFFGGVLFAIFHFYTKESNENTLHTDKLVSFVK